MGHTLYIVGSVIAMIALVSPVIISQYWTMLPRVGNEYRQCNNNATKAMLASLPYEVKSPNECRADDTDHFASIGARYNNEGIVIYHLYMYMIHPNTYSSVY
jgi:hypothetical protein